MIKILIVDDEFTVRQGIKTSIEWSSYDMEIVGEAKNGVEALSLSKELNPNIVLTDIRMPIMDGLTFSAELKKLLPATKIVILTGFDDFKYAKQAISLNVDEYILKPFGTDELIELMLSLKNKIINEQQQIEHYQVSELIIEENLMLLQNKLVNSLITKKYEDYQHIKKNANMIDIYLDGPMYQVLLINIDNTFAHFEGLSFEQIEKLNRQMLSVMTNTFKKQSKATFTTLDRGQYICLLNTHTDSKFFIINLCSQLKSAISEQLNITVTICIGNAYPEIPMFIQSFSEANHALTQRIYQGKNAILHIQNIPAIEQTKQVNYPLSKEKSLLEAIKDKDSNTVSLVSEEIFDFIKTSQFPAERLIQYFTRLILLIMTTIEEMDINLRDETDIDLNILSHIKRFDTIDEIKIWFQEIMVKLTSYIKEDVSGYNQITTTTIQYIKDHYNTKLTLKNLSEIAYVTPNYLSKIFKEQTDQNVMEWLNQYRIEKSKVLLNDIQYKIGEIGIMVGFTDYKHFAYNFKKYTGESLSSYRKSSH